MEFAAEHCVLHEEFDNPLANLIFKLSIVFYCYGKIFMKLLVGIKKIKHLEIKLAAPL